MSSVFVVLPLLVCLFWFVVFAVHYRRADGAKRILTLFFGVCSALYLCHTLLYYIYGGEKLPAPLEGLWAACSLSVYPIYFLYICKLTARPLPPRKVLEVLAPGLLLALAILLWNNKTTDALRQAMTALQVLSVVVFGYGRLRAFDRKLSELYAETEDKNVMSVRILLLAVMMISLNSFVLNILGREAIFASEELIIFAATPISALFLVLGFIGYKRSFRVEQFLADNPEETLPNAPAENSELGAKIETLMVTQAYYLRQNITLTEVAREVGSCRTYVSNYINKELHCSFSDYVNHLRIEHAKMMMLQHARHRSESKFSAIAQDVGFTNEQSFYRNFRRFTGTTPLAWLEKQRNELQSPND